MRTGTKTFLQAAAQNHTQSFEIMKNLPISFRYYGFSRTFCFDRSDNLLNYLTLKFCWIAYGVFLPTYVINKGKTLNSSWTENGPADTAYNVSESGWMETVHFSEWFEKYS
jgi:hypothetical protein